MTNVKNMLTRGGEKVIAHYQLLLASAKNEKERELYLTRIEREQKMLNRLHDNPQFAA